MATAIKNIDRSVLKWERQSAASGPEYEAGIRDPRGDWAQNTQAAEKNYASAVQAAIGRGAFGKGVARAGTAKWQENALAKGPSRWIQGVNLGQAAYKMGFQPYHDVIANLTLPTRGPKGDPKNIERVRVIADALHKKKLDIQGR